jgi:hypothetical protein
MRPPLRAMARPFDFEANHHARRPLPAAASHSLRSRAGLPRPHASVPSHRAPSMGLGGALISSFGGGQHRQNNHHHHPHHPQPGLLARAGAAASGFANRTSSRNLANYGIGPSINGPQQPQNATYQLAYTHPLQPDPGFTHDFASEQTPTSPHRPRHVGMIVIEDDDMEAGPSSATSSKQAHRASSPVSIKSSTVLICARCLDPLVLSAGLVGEDAERRRVWALRCGHLIDGKCLMEIGEPGEDASDEEDDVKADVKGKRKAHAPPVKGKGKGKAKDPDEELGAEHSDSNNAAATVVPGDNSIRSRLRSARTYRSPVVSSLMTSPAATRRKRPPSPRGEGEHRYLCPVVRCGSIHVSVKVNGIWRPERDEDRKKPSGRSTIKYPNDLVADDGGNIEVRGRGAIPVFV